MVVLNSPLDFLLLEELLTEAEVGARLAILNFLLPIVRFQQAVHFVLKTALQLAYSFQIIN